MESEKKGGGMECCFIRAVSARSGIGRRKDMQFRHEWKHEISYSDLLELRARLSAVMRIDPHARDGRYKIRSLYFDNLEDQALREKIDGVNCREKFRLRYYQEDLSYILLEKKEKQNGLCRKEQLRLSAEEVRILLPVNNRNRSPTMKRERKDNVRLMKMEDQTHPAETKEKALPGGEKKLLNELFFKMQSRGLRPKTIVDYIREPFIYAPGNVRVTLDYQIHTGMSCTDFLNPDCTMVPVRGDPMILEVKWDAFLPAVIQDLVQVRGIRTSAFSKYAACRTYD